MASNLHKKWMLRDISSEMFVLKQLATTPRRQYTTGWFRLQPTSLYRCIKFSFNHFVDSLKEETGESARITSVHVVHIINVSLLINTWLQSQEIVLIRNAGRNFQKESHFI